MILAMVSINDLLPKHLQEIIERRSREMHFESPQEYIESLIEQDDNETDWIGRPNLNQLIQEGLDSGPGQIVDADFWVERHRKLEEHIASKKQ